MSFDVTEHQACLMTFGRKGGMVDYSGGNVALSGAVKGVVVCAAGDVVYTPKNDAANQITITGATVGYILPHIPGTIVQTGTTATLATIED